VSAPKFSLWNEFVLLVITVGGALKSAYNGFVNRYIVQRLRWGEEAHTRTKQIEEKLDEVVENQRLQTDAILTLGEQVSNGERGSFDAEAYRDAMDRDDPDRFRNE